MITIPDMIDRRRREIGAENRRAMIVGVVRALAAVALALVAMHLAVKGGANAAATVIQYEAMAAARSW